jgi:phenylalanyl-tRNA synthetase beta chain
VDVNRGSDGSLAAVWECRQVSWRRDVTRGIDLIEEVARHYGYNKFPPHLPPAKRPARRLPHAEANDRLVERAVGLGYQEIVEIPIVDVQRDALFRAEGFQPAEIGNPLAEDASVMRSTGIVSMVRAIEWNLNHGNRDLRLFEIGKTYELRNGAPVETAVLTLGATGLAREKTVHEAAREFSFADLKGDLDRIGELARGLDWQPGGPAWLSAARAARFSLSSQAGVWSVTGGAKAGPVPDVDIRSAQVPGLNIGVAGQLVRRIAEQLKLRQDVYVAELKLEPLLLGIEAARSVLRFVPWPRYPSVERDFSLVLADGVTFAQVEQAIRALEITELQTIEAADLFRGGQIAAGKYSLMIRVKFQSAQGTLTDAQLAEFTSQIVSALEQELGAGLRAS